MDKSALATNPITLARVLFNAFIKLRPLEGRFSANLEGNQRVPSASKAESIDNHLTHGLKPVPFKNKGFSVSCEALLFVEVTRSG